MRRTMVDDFQGHTGKPGSIFIGPVRPNLCEDEFIIICKAHGATTGATGDLAIILQDGCHYVLACDDDVSAYLTSAHDGMEADEETIAGIVSNISIDGVDLVVMGNHALIADGRIFNRQTFSVSGIEISSSRVRLSPSRIKRAHRITAGNRTSPVFA